MKYTVNRASGQSAYIQIYRQLRDDIVAGRLKDGAKLPSKRFAAAELGVSVITVEHAYELLEEEGYIQSRQRSGYYVCFGGSAPALPRTAPQEQRADAPRDFPFSVLARTMRRVLSDSGERILSRAPNRGCTELRQAIAAYLARSRGIIADPEQIIVGSGAEYLYGLVVQLLGRDRVYGLEDPGYEKVRQVYAANGAVCELLPMSDDGIRADALQRTDATVLHVTPFHSFPTGITTSAAKRSEYLAWAAGRDAILIEDDFDSEFSENKKPLQTLYSMDRRGCVIYINTFSHSLAPSMRMGYMVLPEALMARYREQLGFYSCSVPLFDQYVLARFISQGYFERHLNRLRRQNKGK